MIWHGQRDYVKQNSEEMKNALGQDESVPDGVMVGQAFPDVKKHAERVGQPTRQQKQQSARRNAVRQRFDSHHESSPCRHKSLSSRIAGFEGRIIERSGIELS